MPTIFPLRFIDSLDKIVKELGEPSQIIAVLQVIKEICRYLYTKTTKGEDGNRIRS